MIYWFTGQPGSGKTTLSNLLKKELERDRMFTYKVEQLDGDNVRELFQNKDYSEKGRRYNVDIVQKISHYLQTKGDDTIVSLVSPYIDQREQFKKLLGNKIVEIYVHTSEKRERDHFKSDDYQSPKDNFINMDTTDVTPEESIVEILTTLKNKIYEV
jgi:adenylylsulfate kinase|tara:strand:- start:122 stop:592 length:471 start_codon:yes stop_codon:yes gene_type:complete